MTADLNVAVVSLNTRDLTLRCLHATETAGAGKNIVLTLVDNGSTDGTVEAVRLKHPAWRIVIMPENPGYGSALNRAFQEAEGWAYLALNSDSFLSPEAIWSQMEFLLRHPDCGLVGPALSYPDRRPQPSAKRFPRLGFALAELLALHGVLPRSPWVRRFYYADQDLVRNPWVDAISGAVLLIRGDAFRRVGGFDEGFRMYFEETDLCWRLRDAGYRVALCSQATAVHWHGASTMQTSVRQVEYYLSYIRFFRKHYGPRPTRILAGAVAVSTLFRMLALPFKYPPLSRRSRTILRSKLSACGMLLRDLRQSATLRSPTEVLP